jgi:membrane protease subunit (stomatin/prohibitin family)
MRMPSNYDVRNDGIGPYAVFYCERCDREVRTQPDVGGTIARDIGKEAVGGMLRNIPIFGGAAAERVTGEDPRYITHLSPQQLEKAWQQVQDRFHECPTCMLLCCPSCWDPKSGYCTTDTPRSAEIAEAEGEQAASAIKGFASAFGLGDVFKQVAEAAKQASTNTDLARCPNGCTTAPAGAKFCAECGSPMIQPAPAAKCPNCGTDPKGGKFCPECGTKIEAPQAPTTCSNCGTELKGAKFCPECGTRAV